MHGLKQEGLDPACFNVYNRAIGKILPNLGERREIYAIHW